MSRMLRGIMFLVLIGVMLVAVGLLVWWLLPQARDVESTVRSAESKGNSFASKAKADEQKVTSGISALRSKIGEYLPTASSTGTSGGSPASTSAEVQNIAREVRPSVVDVTAVLSKSRTKTLEALGTGVIYSSDGLIVTNNHVLTGDGVGACPHGLCHACFRQAPFGHYRWPGFCPRPCSSSRPGQGTQSRPL